MYNLNGNKNHLFYDFLYPHEFRKNATTIVDNLYAIGVITEQP